MSAFDFKGKRVLVTGASHGIGFAVAAAFAAAGADLVILSSTSDIHRAAERIGSATGKPVHSELCDITDRATVRSAVGGLGDLDVLVNNAGTTRDTLIARMSDEDWEEVIETNLRGTFNTCRAVSRKMLRRRAGAIVNISSVVGVHGNPGQANYAASKAGIIGLTKALARELGIRGVRVNAIAPGYITTELTDVLTEEQTALILGNTPLGRLGSPEDVATTVRFLCSDEAAFITGEVLLVDGGLGS
jgi:3-oxoacyl-[acyl-carrier protein] reductase